MPPAPQNTWREYRARRALTEYEHIRSKFHRDDEKLPRMYDPRASLKEREYTAAQDLLADLLHLLHKTTLRGDRSWAVRHFLWHAVNHYACETGPHTAEQKQEWMDLLNNLDRSGNLLAYDLDEQEVRKSRTTGKTRPAAKKKKPRREGESRAPQARRRR